MLENASFVICWNMFCIVDIISFTFLCKNTIKFNLDKEKARLFQYESNKHSQRDAGRMKI